MTNPRHVLAVLAVLVVTGCGVRPSGIVEAGPPPADTNTRPILVFVSQTGGLQQVRRAQENRKPSVADALELLFAGPTELEREDGLHTALPPITGPVEFTVAGQVATLPIAVTALSEQAQDQIVCTVLSTLLIGGQRHLVPQVRLGDGTGYLTQPRRCPLLS